LNWINWEIKTPKFEPNRYKLDFSVIIDTNFLSSDFFKKNRIIDNQLRKVDATLIRKDNVLKAKISLNISELIGKDSTCIIDALFGSNNIFIKVDTIIKYSADNNFIKSISKQFVGIELENFHAFWISFFLLIVCLLILANSEIRRYTNFSINCYITKINSTNPIDKSKLKNIFKIGIFILVLSIILILWGLLTSVIDKYDDGNHWITIGSILFIIYIIFFPMKDNNIL